MTEDPIERLRAQIAAGELVADGVQLEVAQRLATLARHLRQWRPRRSGLLSVFTRAGSEGPRGLYIHGPVGRGKTMLMDLFFELVAFEPKLRSHFHEFMADVHERIAEARRTLDGEPIPAVAARIADEAGLLCLDELRHRRRDDPRPPVQAAVRARCRRRGDLQRGPAGTLQGWAQSPAVPSLRRFARRAHGGGRALRRQGLPPGQACGPAALFRPRRCARQGPARPTLGPAHGPASGAAREPVKVKGRAVRVPVASMGVARFGFADLCGVALGALDYLHIAHACHTVVLDGVPILTRDRRSAARRFINLIDTLYDNGVCLIASADAEPAQLYPEGPEAEAFVRTVSRLMEMRSEAYLATRHGAQHVIAQP